MLFIDCTDGPLNHLSAHIDEEHRNSEHDDKKYGLRQLFDLIPDIFQLLAIIKQWKRKVKNADFHRKRIDASRELSSQDRKHYLPSRNEAYMIESMLAIECNRFHHLLNTI